MASPEGESAFEGEVLTFRDLQELKQSQVQKSNAQQACIALEKQLKEEQQETKRLEYRELALSYSPCSSS